MNTQLSLQLFGSPQISLQSQPLANLSAKKTRALLIYLAVTGRPHSRETLANLLWGETPKTARQNLKKALATLRKNEAVPLIEQSDRLLRLDENRFSTDVASFKAIVNNLQGQNLSALQQAVDLYQDDYLSGFDISVSYEFEQWVLEEQSQLKSSLIQLLRQTADLYEQQENFNESITLLKRVLQLEPWREEIHRHVMRLLASIGDRGAALMQYEACVEALAAELDVPPDPTTVALAEQIRTNDISVASEVIHPSTSSSGSKRAPAHSSNLPQTSSTMIGRESEVALLEDLIADESTRLVTILGPGGIGKTQLALMVAHRQNEKFADGICWVPLVALTQGEDIVFAIGEALNYSFQGKKPPEEQLLDLLREKHLLLVLDNLEHLFSGLPILSNIFAHAPQVLILVTSRERLRLTNEAILRLDGLAYPQHDFRLQDVVNGTDIYQHYPALELFYVQLQRARPTYQPTQDDWSAMVEICQLVQGVPLGILLAASWSQMLSPTEIAAEIHSDFDFLEADLHDLPDRQRSLRIVFQSAWNRLSEKERDVLMRLSIFRGGCTVDAAKVVANATLPILLGLHDKALVSRSIEGRFELHELLRQFAEESAQKEQIGSELARSHSDYYLKLIAQYEPKLRGNAQAETLTMLRAENENIRAAWSLATTKDDTQSVISAIDGLHLYYRLARQLHMGLAAFKSVRESLKKTSEIENIHLAKSLIWEGDFTRDISGPVVARRLFEQGLTILEQLNDDGYDVRAERGSALWRLGDLLWYVDFQKSQQVLRESLSVLQSLGNHWREPYVLRALGRNSYSNGELENAESYIQESIRLSRINGDGTSLKQALAIARGIALEQCNFESALRYAEEQTTFGNQLSNLKAVANDNFYLGRTYLESGRLNKALAIMDEARLLAQAEGDHHHESTCSFDLSRIALHRGNYNLATKWAESVVSRADALGLRAHRAQGLTTLSQVYLAHGEYTLASSTLDECHQLFSSLDQNTRILSLMPLMGITAAFLGINCQALQYLFDALQSAMLNGSKSVILLALPLASLLLLEKNEFEQAIEFYALACTHPLIANSKWYDDVVGQRIRKAAEKLPNRTVSAASERGQNRNLDEAVQTILTEITRDQQAVAS